MNIKICFLGAGKLATHLATALQQNGFEISQVYSRTEASARELSEKLKTKYTTSVKGINSDADIFFVALKDSVVSEIISEINFQNKLVVHCSGSLPLTVLKNCSENTGVFYPLQTFTKERNLDFSSIPIFIEANNLTSEELLLRIAQKASTKTYVYDSEKRKSLHIAAVFACNFVNHFYTIASEYLKNQNIPFEVLRPLILETALKIQEMKPMEAQTGPAVRFDENIISKHIDELDGLSNYAELYNLISKSIFEHHSKTK